MAVTLLKNIKENKKGNPSAHLKNAIHYILNPDKTENGLWTGGNCGNDTEEIFSAMIQTKKEWGKEWGRQGYHFVISFPPGEASEEIVFKIGKEFCEKYLGEAYDYCFAVHNDHKHMHCHIVFNSVGRFDGLKYRYVDGDWEKKIQPITDEICVKNNMPPLTFDKTNRIGKSYTEHVAECQGKITWKKILCTDMNYAAGLANSEQEFLTIMHEFGYQTRMGMSKIHGQYVAYTPPGRSKAFRDYNLGAGFSLQDINVKIKSNKETDIAAVDFYPRKLFTINSEMSKYQVCAVSRIDQASAYQFYDRLAIDQARVRKDLININRLEEECSYILEHKIYTPDDAERQLEYIKKKIAIINNEPKANDKNPEYELLQQQISKCSSDEEFEQLSDQLEEMTQRHPEYLMQKATTLKDENLELLKEEKRILSRIVKSTDDTLKINRLARKDLNINIQNSTIYKKQ